MKPEPDGAQSTDPTRGGAPDGKPAHRLDAFLDWSRALPSSADPADVLQATVTGVTTMIGLDSAAVYLRDGDRMRLESTVPPLAEDFPEHLRVASLADHPHMAEAMRRRRSLYVRDCHREAWTPAERAVVEARGLSTLLYVPIVSDEERLGVFIVGAVGRTVALTDEAVNLTITLGNLTALAVRHLRLLGESRSYAMRLEEALLEQLRADKERRDLLDRLTQARKMESIGRLAGGVAHDFNNLLGVILGYADMALEQVSDDETLREDLGEIRDAARRSSEITAQLLAFARRQKRRPRTLDVNARVEGALKMLRRLVGEDIELRWSPGVDLPPVRLDPTQFDQILVNLCANARDAIADVGRIEITTTTARLGAEDCDGREDRAPGDYVVLSVRDDGVGIDADTLPSIFEPFFTTKPEGAGTGLGLATVHGVVQQNGAAIDVESEPGGGATFRILLPVFTGAPSVQGSPSAPTPRSIPVGETVLVAEDEPRLRRVVTRMLEARGYSVLASRSPSHAVELADRHGKALDLLITDVIMPRMNGRELAAQVRRRHPGVAVLYVSGYASDSVAQRGVLEDGIHFLQKPFGRDALLQSVRAALDGDDPVGDAPR